MMLAITPNLERNPWSDLTAKCHIGEAERIGRLPRGLVSGNASVAVMGRLPNGQPVIFQMSLDMLAAAVDVMRVAEQQDQERISDN